MAQYSVPSSELFSPDLPPGTLHLSARLTAAEQKRLLAAVRRIEKKAPFRKPQTRWGTFSAEITNCGNVGWWSDSTGYRYIATQPDSGSPWPKMPPDFTEVLASIIVKTPWQEFVSDVCLINHYGKGAKMGLHQDKDESDFTQPIVTFCLGATADFLVGGAKRSDRPQVITVESGDVIVMGAESRLFFHGVRKIYPGTSPFLGLDGRISLTFRKAL